MYFPSIFFSWRFLTPNGVAIQLYWHGNNIKVLLLLDKRDENSEVLIFIQFAQPCSVQMSNNLKKIPPNEFPRYDTKQSNSEAQVIVELWGMRSTPSLPSLPGSLWHEVVALDRVLSMAQIELKCVLMLNWTTWNSTWTTVWIFKRRTYVKQNRYN